MEKTAVFCKDEPHVEVVIPAFSAMRGKIIPSHRETAMIQSNGAVGVCLSSLLLEWRRGALRICSADAGDLAGLPFPKQGVQLRGFALELFRNGDGAWVICKYLLPAYEDGEDGVSYHYWKIKYRRLLRREGVYKMEARKSWLMPCEILAEYYNPVGQDGEVVWEPKAT